MTTKLSTTLLLHATLALPATAQQPDALLFTPLKDEQTASGSAGSAPLSKLSPRSVALVTPRPAVPYSAEEFAPPWGRQTIIGDEDGDGDVYTQNLLGSVDAALVKPYEYDLAGNLVPRMSPVRWFDVYVSPKLDVGTNVSGAPGLRRGDCGTHLRNGAANGQVKHFITAEQIITAFGMLDPQTGNRLDPSVLDLDAITVDVNRNILLSFEDDVTMTLQIGGAVAAVLLTDGGVAWLPPGAWMPDAVGDVAAVAAQQGRIALYEFQVDAMVANANASDNAGNCPVAINDTDALAIEPAGGMFPVPWGGAVFPCPHLLFAGETLTGAGVLTTGGGGTIAVVNGQPLAAACGVNTTGRQMGLAPVTGVSSLDALEALEREPARFVLATPAPSVLPGMIEVHIGTNLPLPMVWLGVGLGALPISPSIDFRPFFPGTLAFPELYPGVLGAGLLVPMVPDGFGSFVGVLGPVPAPFVPTGILFQAAGVAGGSVHLSSPGTIH